MGAGPFPRFASDFFAVEPTIRIEKRINTRIHGKHSEVNERRTQESQTHCPQET